MAFRHPCIPETQWRAASSFGKLVAQHVVEEDDAVAALCRAAEPHLLPDTDRRGVRTMLLWQVRDAAAYWRNERDKADFFIRRDIRPLIEQRAPAIAITRAAHDANKSRGEPLLRREVVDLVAEEIQAALRAMRFTRRRRGHVG